MTLNHRINVFGFLNLGVFSPRYEHAANVGLLDILAALRWIHENIAAFGGDPSNVTVFGQSGGGAKVNYLMCMPAAKGLLHKAIAQSPGTSLSQGLTPDRSAALAWLVLDELNLTTDSVDKIADVSDHAIAGAALTALQRAKGALEILPTIDGDLVPEAPFAVAPPSVSANVTLIVGTTMRESAPNLVNTSVQMNFAAVQRELAATHGPGAAGIVEAFRDAYPNAAPVDLWWQIRTFADRRSAIRQVQLKASAGQAPAYLFLFTWLTKSFDGLPRAFHGSDVPFVFDNTDLCAPMTGGTLEARQLAARMAGAWVNFARTGNPDHPDLPSWTRVTAETVPTMIFDDQCEVRRDHDARAGALLPN